MASARLQKEINDLMRELLFFFFLFDGGGDLHRCAGSLLTNSVFKVDVNTYA
jgi:hypothetical protein